MRRWIPLRRWRLLVTVLVMLGLTGTSASANARSSQSLRLTADVAQLAVPGDGDAGTVRGSLGRGAIVLSSTVSGATLSTRGTVWLAAGTLELSSTELAVPEADGSVQLNGKGKVTGGTGAFAGARGSFLITATLPSANETRLTVRIIGTIKRDSS